MSEITLIRDNGQASEFREKNPDGYTIMNGDKGIGLTGKLAEEAKNIGGNPNDWIKFASIISPAIHEVYEIK